VPTYDTLALVKARGISGDELQRAGVQAFFRLRDVRPLGCSFRDLQRLVEAGEVEKVGVGLYRLATAPASELETLAMVGAAVPHGIVCLLSALRLHEIGTQAPHEVWLAIDRKARKPSAARLPVRVRVVRYSGRMLRYGVIERPILGVPVRVTSPARTVVDCFRYRKKLGIDVAVEALRDAIRSRKATIAEIDRAAEVCRAGTVLRPFLEALVP
jgi:predicted transcriptional regulator of viral defense system